MSNNKEKSEQTEDVFLPNKIAILKALQGVPHYCVESIFKSVRLELAQTVINADDRVEYMKKHLTH